ncbi:hypothetical protein KLP40_18885 [Hymenobacter sp. NST-14]|uniref:hypothetical protein n=1 Tax=Hymenobacter piscis TaxID=2839984 RepID=UPI001C02AC06|nr:hypothetical protein [Hymenobacter piscis]MBT9395242.1 hypothetical protein [Hymenobacter piscis]
MALLNILYISTLLQHNRLAKETPTICFSTRGMPGTYYQNHAAPAPGQPHPEFPSITKTTQSRCALPAPIDKGG